MLRRASAAFHNEIAATARAAWDVRLALLLGIVAALLTLAAQQPISYHIEVGQEDGPGSDLPLLRGFFTPEHSADDIFRWRWTSDRAVIRLPGLGQRPVALALRVLAVNDEVAQRGPQTLVLWANGQPVAQLPVRASGATYRVLLPAPPDGSGNQQLEIRSATFVPTGDERAVGSPVDDLLISTSGMAAPAWPALLLWLAVTTLLWLALRAAGFTPASTLTLLLPLALLLGLATALDPPRTAFGALPALVAVALGWLLVLILRAAAPPLARRVAVPLDRRALRWLLLLAFVVFTMRFGGKLYPDSMPGDIGFHANRFTEVLGGMVLLLSRNRGVDFPYPPALYLLVAPWSLLGLSPRVLLRLGGALLDAASPFLIYAIAMRARTTDDRRRTTDDTGSRRRGEEEKRSNISPRLLVSSSPALPTWPLLAAGIYSLSAAGFMTTWWNFSTHIFAQAAHLLLITALVLWWANDEHQASSIKKPFSILNSQFSILMLLQSLVFLGHFGFWINMTLLSGMGFVLALGWARRGHGLAHSARLLGNRGGILLASFIAAELLAALLFYSAYSGLFLAQAQATATGGLTGLADRAPVSRAVLWATLWDAGLRTHFGFFPIPLALAGLALLWRRPQGGRRNAMLLFLLGGTFVIAVGFALLPFVSGSTLSTRWLMFAAWGIAVAAALTADRLWRAGRAGRLLVLLMGSFMLWITLSQWIVALAWRVRPPEPF